MARPCRQVIILLKEINKVYPHRDKHSDGIWGSTTHNQKNPASDHIPNEHGIICAIDIDEDLFGVPAKYRHGDYIVPGVDTAKPLRDHLLRECRAGRNKTIHYIISEQKIYSRTKKGPDGHYWSANAYHGVSAHKEHTHVSFTQAPHLYSATTGFRIAA